MFPNVSLQGRWDKEAGVWTVTSDDVPGLVIEADGWPAALEEIRLVLPDLLELAQLR